MSREIPVYTKDPSAKVDYAVNWSDWLDDGETISLSAWGIDIKQDDNLTIASSPPATNTTTTATVWLEGGTAGRTYRVRNRVTTSAGRTDDQSLDICVFQH